MVSIRRKRARAAAAAAEEAAAAAVEKLRRIQHQLKKVNKKAREEISAIEQKCMEKRDTVYKIRNGIISEIPGFWLTVFMDHPMLENLLREEDQEIFCYLNSVYVEDFADPRMGYYIAFNFRENPFFHNKILTKTINFLDDGTLRAIGTIIDWKAGKGPTDEKEGNRRPFPVGSFLSWFSSPEEVEQDLIAKIIKEEIWPNPIDCLLTIPDDEVDFDDDDEDEDD